MIGFLKTNGILIVAILAFVQPWLIILWKKFFKRGHMEIYQTGQLEVSYSTFGATLGVLGTLRAFNVDMFIKNISIELVKLKNSSKSKFEWGIFRDQKYKLSGEHDTTLDLPSAFMVAKSLPKNFNIQFHNKEVQAEINRILKELQDKWFDKLKENKLFSTSLEDPTAKVKMSALYNSFKKEPIHTDSYTQLDRLFDWEAGDYSLEIRVETSKPDKEFTKRLKFKLAEGDFKSLRLNTIKMLNDTCEQSAYGDYSFVFVECH